MQKKKAITELVTAKLLGEELDVSKIANRWGNVDEKTLSENVCFVRLHGDGYQTASFEKACKELQVPYALYRGSWKKHGSKFYPQFAGVVVRVDHAEQVKRYMKERFRQRTFQGIVPERRSE